MGALFTVSYWITLVTVLPGLITIATVYGGVPFVNHSQSEVLNAFLSGLSDWILIAFVILIRDGSFLSSAIGYSVIMLVCLIISYPVAIIRFREMARSIWASDRVTGEMTVDVELE